MFTFDLIHAVKLSAFSFASSFSLLLVAMAADILIGYLAAGVQKKIASSIFGNGTRKKLITIVLVLVLECFHVYLMFEAGEYSIPPIGKYAALVMFFVELNSLLEHAAAAGVQNVPYLRTLLAPFINRLAVANNGGIKPDTQYIQVQKLVEAVNHVTETQEAPTHA